MSKTRFEAFSDGVIAILGNHHPLVAVVSLATDRRIERAVEARAA